MTTHTEEDDGTTPALFRHCQSAYNEMLAQATRLPMDGGGDGIVYQGYLTELFKNKLNLSVPYYTHVTRALNKMGCVKQLRRGGSSTESQWLLIKEPTKEAFEEVAGSTNTRTRYVTVGEHRALTQRLADMNTRLSKLEKMLGAG